MRLLLLLLLASPLARAQLITYDQGVAYLTRWEGYRLRPYRDGNAWAVGVGHNLTARGEAVKPLYTAAEVRVLFTRDFAVARETCEQSIVGFATLPLEVQQVCLAVAFGTGRTGFARFKGFRLAVGRHAWNAAATELSVSKWARQVSRERADTAIQTLLHQ